MTETEPRLHVPGVEPRQKLDAAEGLFGGTCSCRWRQSGVHVEAEARYAAEQHARAKNAAERERAERVEGGTS
jgi:hypothetical protein